MTAGAPHAGTNARRDLVHAAEIAATGGFLPGDLVDNAAYDARCRFPIAHDRAALAEATRVRTRAWCRDGETTFTMALGAVENALAADPALKDEIDVVVAVSATTVPGFSPPEREHPGMADLAPLLFRALGRHDALGFDVRAVNCAGFLRGLQIVVDGLLANPGYRAGLVVATERCSSLAALAEARAKNVIQKGDLVLSLAVGAGLSSAGALYRM